MLLVVVVVVEMSKKANTHNLKEAEIHTKDNLKPRKLDSGYLFKISEWLASLQYLPLRFDWVSDILPEF